MRVTKICLVCTYLPLMIQTKIELPDYLDIWKRVILKAAFLCFKRTQILTFSITN